MAKKVLFVGDMRVAFIRQDAALLEESSSVEIANVSGFRPIPRNKMDLKTWINILSKMPSQISRNDVTWVWFADCHSLIFLLCSKIMGKKFVVQVGGGEVVAFPEVNYGMQLEPVRGWIVRQVVKHADIVITDSYAYKERIVNLVGGDIKSRIHVSPNYLQDKIFEIPVPEKKDWVVTAYCSDQNPELKGLPTFRALAKIRPYEFKEFKALKHDKLIEMLLQSKVYCQLSITEGDGVTVKEAMACGCVPVVTDTDAMPGNVGDTGIAVPYGKPEVIASAIDIALTMDGNRARERARQMFTWEKSVAIKKDIISELFP